MRYEDTHKSQSKPYLISIHTNKCMHILTKKSDDRNKINVSYKRVNNFKQITLLNDNNQFLDSHTRTRTKESKLSQ